jgi:tryptophan synthase alpha chain
MSRYQAMFARLTAAGEGAFIPFVVLGDPNPIESTHVIEALVRGGADALELGIPFSDPVADGPTIAAADVRALEAGTTPQAAFDILTAVRAAHPTLPIGLLVYANLVEANGRDAFYARCHAAGVDSVLVADVPTLEAAPFAEAAQRMKVDPVFIAAPNTSPEHLQQVAALSRGYTYVVTRMGVTGTETEADLEHHHTLTLLRDAGAPPPVFGFGIATPEHVAQALAAGAAGAISGSAVVQIIAQHPLDAPARNSALEHFVKTMKAATTRR